MKRTILFTLLAFLIFSFLYFAFGKRVTQLLYPLDNDKIIQINIEKKNLNKLKKYSENYTINNGLPIKKWVNATLIENSKEINIKLKLHGKSSPHYWNKLNRNSYTIKTDENKEIYKYSRYKLIIDEECNPTINVINNIAHSFGLIAPLGTMKSVKINNNEYGIYSFVIDLKSKKFIKEFGIKNFSLISNTDDWSRKEFSSTGVRHISDLDFYSGHIKKSKSKNHSVAIGYYKLLFQLISKNQINSIKKLIDINYIGKFLALASLFNDVHFMTGDNLKFIFDHDKKMFFPIFRAEQSGIGLPYIDLISFSNFNSFLFKSNDSNSKNYSNAVNLKFFKILLSDNEIRNLRDKYLFSILTDSSTFFSNIQNEYNLNKKIMYHSDLNYNHFEEKIKKQILNLKEIFVVADKYLKYGHIYGSHNKKDSSLNIISDVFCQLKIVSNYDSSITFFSNGINFDSNLSIKYNEIDIPNIKNFKNIYDYSFINNVTKDTISWDHIHINSITELKTFDKKY